MPSNLIDARGRFALRRLKPFSYPRHTDLSQMVPTDHHGQVDEPVMDMYGDVSKDRIFRRGVQIGYRDSGGTARYFNPADVPKPRKARKPKRKITTYYHCSSCAANRAGRTAAGLGPSRDTAHTSGACAATYSEIKKAE